jgi:hypothetical protein
MTSDPSFPLPGLLQPYYLQLNSLCVALTPIQDSAITRTANESILTGAVHLKVTDEHDNPLTPTVLERAGLTVEWLLKDVREKKEQLSGHFLPGRTSPSIWTEQGSLQPDGTYLIQIVLTGE